MLFPAANGTAVPLTPDDAWKAARQAASAIQSQCATLAAQINSGSVSSQIIVNATSFFATINSNLTTYAAVPGIVAYAQGQINNPTGDVAGAFSAMQTALVAVLTWIVTSFPKDSNGNLLYAQFNGAGLAVYTQFTQAQLSGLSPLLTALAATIN